MHNATVHSTFVALPVIRQPPLRRNRPPTPPLQTSPPVLKNLLSKKQRLHNGPLHFIAFPVIRQPSRERKPARHMNGKRSEKKTNNKHANQMSGTTMRSIMQAF